MNRYRKFITSSVGFAFVVVGITGVIFKFFFKSHPLEEIHGWIGIGMVVAAIAHIAQNWKPLRGYFGDWRVFLLLVPIVLVIAGFGFGSDERGGGERDGFNPRAVMHKLSEADAGDVAKVFGKDLNAVFAAMKANGLRGGNADDTVEALARENQKSPEDILAYFAN